MMSRVSCWRSLKRLRNSTEILGRSMRIHSAAMKEMKSTSSVLPTLAVMPTTPPVMPLRSVPALESSQSAPFLMAELTTSVVMKVASAEM